MTIYPVADPLTRGPGLDAAVHATSRGGLVVLPTDTVYGIGADAFQASAVARLLAAKGRDRTMPPPVLVPSAQTVAGLVADLPPEGEALISTFWPGALTLICWAQPSLVWDLGETAGTVAVRMPDDPVALALLERTGPLAVSSANLTGHPAATTVHAAVDQLGTSVDVYLDGGPAAGGVASTIVDLTGIGHGRGLGIVRLGAISSARLAEVVDVDGGDMTT